jgi:hypothetical protein
MSMSARSATPATPSKLGGMSPPAKTTASIIEVKRKKLKGKKQTKANF